MERLDRRMRIYRIDGGTDDDGRPVRIKHYLNLDRDDRHLFRCAFRDLSSKEMARAKELGLEATAQFLMNMSLVDRDCFIEIDGVLGTRTFRVSAVDRYDARSRTRMKVTAVETVPGRFDGVKWGFQE